MIRRAAATLVCAALLTTASAPPAKLHARFDTQDCRRVALADSRTGGRIAGAEDIARSPDGAMLIVSAHDRLDPARPDGGLYAVRVDDLVSGTVAVVRPLVDIASRATPFRPHGIALSPDGRRLAVVNRIAERDAVIEIGRLTAWAWRPDTVVRDPRLCRANDLAFDSGGGLTVAIDRADCAASVRDMLSATPTGSLGRIEGGRFRTVATGLHFPNGIALETVAETRAQRLLRPDGRWVALPGGPDNLAADGDALIVAAHPGLLRLWAYLNGWSDRAPSRILRVTADDRIELLFDDPAGALFSGATAGIMAGGLLVAGSARDSGLLVCGRPT